MYLHTKYDVILYLREYTAMLIEYIQQLLKIKKNKIILHFKSSREKMGRETTPLYVIRRRLLKYTYNNKSKVVNKNRNEKQFEKKYK